VDARDRILGPTNMETTSEFSIFHVLVLICLVVGVFAIRYVWRSWKGAGQRWREAWHAWKK